MNLTKLMNKNSKAELSKGDLALLEKLSNHVQAVKNEEEQPDMDSLYAYYCLAQKGLINESEEELKEIGIGIAWEYEELREDFFSTYPEVEKCLIDCNFETVTCLNLGYYYEDKKDYHKAFLFYEKGSNSTLTGLRGGYGLVNPLIMIDYCRSSLADCYLHGKGVEKDLVKAFLTYQKIGTDHLVQKYSDIIYYMDNYKEIYDNLIKDVEKGNIKDGTYYALAVMSHEGLGTNYNYENYMKFLSLENGKEFSRLARIYKIDNLHRNTIDFNQKIEKVHKIEDALKINDIVEYGKYNNRSLLWKVINVSEEDYLLLCSDVIESLYIAEDSGQITFDKRDGLFSDFLNNRFLKQIDHYNENLVDTKFGYAFLLNKIEVEKYLPNPSDRLCGVRVQAMLNGYDEYGVDAYGPSPWWVDHENVNDEGYAFIDCDGEFDTVNNKNNSIGIRPAILLKRKKNEK